jgi:molybdopterin synthase catalytic subunit
MDTIRIQNNDFDLAQEYQLLRGLSATVGGVVTFSGLVRDFERESSIESLSLQHYPGMTENLLQEIIDQANARWNLIGITIIHRVGRLLPTDQIVFVGVASEHRGEGFTAAQFLMDYLKAKATFWKQVSQDGKQFWVDSKPSDADAAASWESNEG